MRFLCLPGAGANAETFRMQILPIVSDLEHDGTASFHFIHGTVSSPPPNGFEDHYGSPPHLRFLDFALLGMTEDEFRNAIWATPRYLTPEQKYHHHRHLIQPKGTEGADALQQIFDRMYRILDEEGPFEGILGHSEGATIAATFLIDYLGKVASKERQAQLRCAVFMGGGTAFRADGKGVYLADEHGPMISIPTCHIIGYNDNLIDSAIALYHLCQEDSATIVDHGKGHIIPQDERSSMLMVNGIRDLIACCSADQSQ